MSTVLSYVLGHFPRIGIGDPPLALGGSPMPILGQSLYLGSPSESGLCEHNIILCTLDCQVGADNVS